MCLKNLVTFKRYIQEFFISFHIFKLNFLFDNRGSQYFNYTVWRLWSSQKCNKFVQEQFLLQISFLSIQMLVPRRLTFFFFFYVRVWRWVFPEPKRPLERELLQNTKATQRRDLERRITWSKQHGPRISQLNNSLNP